MYAAVVVASARIIRRLITAVFPDPTGLKNENSVTLAGVEEATLPGKCAQADTVREEIEVVPRVAQFYAQGFTEFSVFSIRKYSIISSFVICIVFLK